MAAEYCVARFALPDDAPAARALAVAAAAPADQWRATPVYSRQRRSTDVQRDVRDSETYAGALPPALLEPSRVPDAASLVAPDEKFGAPTIVFEDWALLRYAAGAHFVRHTDGRASQQHFGTVLLWPPRAHEGGELVLHRDGGDTIIEAHDTLWTAVVLRCDVPHCVARVRAGPRYAFKARAVARRALVPRRRELPMPAQAPLDSMVAVRDGLNARIAAARRQPQNIPAGAHIVVLSRTYDWLPAPGADLLDARDATGYLDDVDALAVQRVVQLHGGAWLGLVPLDIEGDDDASIRGATTVTLHLGEDPRPDLSDEVRLGVACMGDLACPAATEDKHCSLYNDETYDHHLYALCACVVADAAVDGAPVRAIVESARGEHLRTPICSRAYD